ncbi:MAG: FAD-dependent oxidoreductase [Armatimonadetes bacterium]|nr:FAD-dependent oxidoreductase [Armatimonadota bacterium]
MLELEADVIVIGAGGAGLRAAVAAKEAGADVLVLEKGIAGKSGCTQNSASDWMAYGAAFGHADQRDNPHEHWLDIMIKGALVARPELARRIAYESPQRLLDLERWGASFDKKDGKFVQILSDGARFPRACGKGTNTGPEIERVLLERARDLGVRFVEGIMTADLIMAGEQPGRVIGCWGITEGGRELAVFGAPAIILATGGAGELYSFNVFPEDMTGDGMAMAYRAGAELVNMEFIQIGPCIIHPLKFALSGVFWRMNPRLLNGNGEEFLSKRIPKGINIGNALTLKGVSFPFSVRNESMYIDIAVYEEIVTGVPGLHGGVYLDISHNSSAEIETRARVPFEHLLARGIDIRKEPVEFAPSVQHFNGGVLIDERASTKIKGLYACGEVAGGQHGADRPGGNALADSQVFGAIAGAEAANYAIGQKVQPELVKVIVEQQVRSYQAVPVNEQIEWEALLTSIQRAMWRNVSVVRTESRLGMMEASIREAKSILAKARPADMRRYFEMRNIIDVCHMIVTAARARTESRGTHYRADYPRRDDGNWLKQIILTRADKKPHVSMERIEVPNDIIDGLRTGTLVMD